MRRDTMGKRFGSSPLSLPTGLGGLAMTGIHVYQVSEADRAAARHMSDLLDMAHQVHEQG